MSKYCSVGPRDNGLSSIIRCSSWIVHAMDISYPWRESENVSFTRLYPVHIYSVMIHVFHRIYYFWIRVKTLWWEGMSDIIYLCYSNLVMICVSFKVSFPTAFRCWAWSSRVFSYINMLYISESPKSMFSIVSCAFFWNIFNHVTYIANIAFLYDRSKLYNRFFYFVTVALISFIEQLSMNWCIFMEWLYFSKC